MDKRLEEIALCKWEGMKSLPRDIYAVEKDGSALVAEVTMNQYTARIIEMHNHLLSLIRKKEEALRAVMSQCSGHSDEFSGNVYRAAKKALSLGHEETK